MSSTRGIRATLALCLSLVAGVVSAAPPPINTLGESPGWFRSPEPTGVAIRGYDTVAYHTLGQALPGSAEHTVEYQGAIWQFANAEHKALFAANPEAYAPAYGGYCAYGVAKGDLVKVEPDQWDIIDGQLYLNYDAGVSKRWRKDAARFIQAADAQFPTLLSD